MTSQKTALVLGGKTGLVGQALVEVLKAAHWNVAVSTREDVDFTAQNAADRLAALIDKVEPDCLFNTVAYTKVDAAEDDPEGAKLLNRTVPAMIGRLIRNRPTRFVHYSTDFVFNGKKKSPYVTEDLTAPQSVYGKTKLDGEDVILSMDLADFCIIRTAWLFGPGRGNFVRTIIEKCKEKKSLNVVHDQIGSPTYSIDLAQHTLKLVDSGVSGIFHIVNSGQASWCELAAEAVSLSQTECAINAVPSSAYPQKAPRPAMSVLDTRSLVRATGISPRPWPQALRDYIFRDFPAESSTFV